MVSENRQQMHESGQRNTGPDAKGSTRSNAGAITAAEALQAEDARYDAQIENDLEALERMFGKELVYIHSSTVQDTKSSFIESLRSGKVRYHSMQRSDTRVRVFGNVAIISGRADFEVTARGKDKTLNLLFHSIWVKRDSGVEFVSWQATPLVV